MSTEPRGAWYLIKQQKTKWRYNLLLSLQPNYKRCKMFLVLSMVSKQTCFFVFFFILYSVNLFLFLENDVKLPLNAYRSLVQSKFKAAVEPCGVQPLEVLLALIYNIGVWTHWIVSSLLSPEFFECSKISLQMIWNCPRQLENTMGSHNIM